jgi:predicted TIM-barrel fold metal-dependent hydrolase
MSQDIPIVDAHHHLWDLSRGRYPWLQDAYDAGKSFLGDYRDLCRDFLPSDYAAASTGCNVVATVHVEAERARDEALAETEWLHAVHAAHGFPNAVVAYAALTAPDADEQLARQAAWPLVRGIRCKPVTAGSPSDSVRRQPGSLQDEAWPRGLELLTRHGLSWDLRVPYWHLQEAAEVAGMFPQLPIALNHHGLAWDRSEAGLTHWRRGMEALARHPNMHVKLSEFGLRGQPWDFDANARIVRETLSIFGWQRCMFASNFPVASLRIGYAPLVDAMLRMLAPLEAQQLRAVMGGNAMRFYRIDACGAKK